MINMLRQELAAVRAQGLSRALRPLSSPQGREVLLQGRRVLNFCSNDYLGLAADTRLIQAARDAFSNYGFGSGAARLVCGDSDEHSLLERDIAEFKGTAAALVFSTGYMANTGVIPALCGRSDVVFSDRLNHASIVDGIILSRASLKRYRHVDINALEQMLRLSVQEGRRLIVTDSVFSMDGDLAPIAELTALARRYGAWVMLDEAHAFGVFGSSGRGLAQELGVEGAVDVQMGTLSKAAGCFGAYVAGSRELIDHLINKARSFIYSTAMPPAMASAARQALRIMRDEPERRERVMSFAGRLRGDLRRAGFDTMQSLSPIIPVMIGDNQRARDFSEALLERGILASAIRPPTVPPGTARLRVTVTAAHREEDLARCVQAFVQVREQLS